MRQDDKWVRPPCLGTRRPAVARFKRALPQSGAQLKVKSARGKFAKPSCASTAASILEFGAAEPQECAGAPPLPTTELPPTSVEPSNRAPQALEELRPRLCCGGCGLLQTHLRPSAECFGCFLSEFSQQPSKPSRSQVAHGSGRGRARWSRPRSEESTAAAT